MTQRSFLSVLNLTFSINRPMLSSSNFSAFFNLSFIQKSLPKEKAHGQSHVLWCLLATTLINLSEFDFFISLDNYCCKTYKCQDDFFIYFHSIPPLGGYVVSYNIVVAPYLLYLIFFPKSICHSKSEKGNINIGTHH